MSLDFRRGFFQTFGSWAYAALIKELARLFSLVTRLKLLDGPKWKLLAEFTLTPRLQIQESRGQGPRR